MAYTSQPGLAQPGLFWPGSLANDTVAVSGSDSGSATEANSLAVTLNSSDSATGTQAQSIAATLSSSDSGSGTESQSIVVTLAGTDSGSVTETESVNTGSNILLVHQNTGTSTTQNTTASVTTTTAGNFLVALFARSGGLSTGALTSVTDSAGQTWTLATRGAKSGTTYTRIECWYIANSAPITSVTFNSGTAQNNSWLITEFSGVASSSPLDVASPDNSSAVGDTTVTTPNITTLNANDLVITAQHHPSTTSDSNTDGSFTDLNAFDYPGLGVARAAYKIVSSTGSYSDNWTIAGGNPAGFGILTVSFKSAGGNDSSIFSTDTGTGTESQSVAVTLTSADNNTATESQSLNITLSSTDSVSSTESQSISLSGIPKNSSDSASGTESQSISVSLSISDTATGTEDNTIAATLSSSDTRSATESIHLATDWSNTASATTFLPGDIFEDTLIMGPATIYIGSFGATEPLDTAIGSAPSSVDWTDLGATLGGVNLTFKQTFETSEVFDQIEEKVNSRLKKRDFTFSTDLAEPSIEKFPYLLNNGTVTTGSGYKNYTPTATMDEATPLTYTALIIDGWAPDFNANGRHKRRRVIIRKSLSIGDVVLNYSQDKQTVQSVTWAAHRVDGVIQPVKIIDES